VAGAGRGPAGVEEAIEEHQDSATNVACVVGTDRKDGPCQTRGLDEVCVCVFVLQPGYGTFSSSFCRHIRILSQAATQLLPDRWGSV
jgi:hypothetical protein